MSGKGMGSDGTYITVEEAAAIHGVHVSQVHAWSRGGMLEAYYPKGRRAGKRFRRQDVLDLLELREQEWAGLRKKLPQLALEAIVTSRRVEKRLNELVYYLGLSEEQLAVGKDEVVMLFVQVQSFLDIPIVENHEAAIRWARVLLGITEDYLGLVSLYLEEPEPWAIYMELGRVLASKCSPNTSARMFIEHARKNLRNVAYFYLRGSKGARVAGHLFPGESYSGRLLQTLFPL